MPPFETLNHLVGLGTVGMQLLAVVLIILFFARGHFPGLAGFISRWGLWFSLLLTLFSIAMALYYSDVLGIIPCSWCWYQRIFLFPQAILFVVALVKREAARVADYSLWLSAFGAAVALYQHYIQMVGEGPLPCPAGGGDCVKRFLFEFGYITFPLVSFSVFALLIIIMLFMRAKKTP
jgi:disulfide bond formation protein DsbB